MFLLRKKKYRICLAALLLPCLLLMGCGKNSVSARIEYMQFEDTGNNIVEIPQFVTDAGDSTLALDKLNRAVGFLEDLYEDTAEKQDGSYVEIRSYPADTGRFLQVTTIYRVFPPDESEGDLITLAYDTKTDTAILPEDALKQSGIASDQLSIDVHAAYVASGGQLEVISTDMQGFELAEDGTLTAIYMKLGLYDKETDEEQQIFCRYLPEDGTLSIKDFGEGMDGG